MKESSNLKMHQQTPSPHLDTRRSLAQSQKVIFRRSSLNQQDTHDDIPDPPSQDSPFEHGKVEGEELLSSSPFQDNLHHHDQEVITDHLQMHERNYLMHGRGNASANGDYAGMQLPSGEAGGTIDNNLELEFNFDGYLHQELIERNLNMQCFLQTYTSKDCIVCHPILQQMFREQQQQQMFMLSPDDSKTATPAEFQSHTPSQVGSYQGIIQDNLRRKYMTSKDFYNVKIVNDIIYNEGTHIVAIFKDYLIYDDLSEFLKRYYEDQEAAPRLPKICEFYEKYSKVFPNYVTIPESKFMYKNIERKQKAIDDRQRLLQDKRAQKQEKIKEKMRKAACAEGAQIIMDSAQDIGDAELDKYESSMSWIKNSEIRFFDTKFMESIYKQDVILSQHSEFMQQSQMLLDQSNRKIKPPGQPVIGSKDKRNFTELTLESLIQAFLTKDSNRVTTNNSNITGTLDFTMPSFNMHDESEKFVKAMLQQQQQKQKDLKMTKQTTNSRKDPCNAPLPHGPSSKPVAIKATAESYQQQQTMNPPTTTTSQQSNNNPPKMLFSNQAAGCNTGGGSYLKQQKPFFDKAKTDSKKKSGGQSQSPPGGTTLVKGQSPPKAQQFQQIYGSTLVKQTTQQQQQQPAMAKHQSSQSPSTGVHIIPKKQVIKKQNTLTQAKPPSQLQQQQMQPHHGSSQQQQDFKIKHGAGSIMLQQAQIPSYNSLVSNHGAVGGGGSLTQRESIKKKLVNNLVVEKQHQQNNFSPLDMQDQVTGGVGSHSKKPQIMGSYAKQVAGNTTKPSLAYYQSGSQSARVNSHEETNFRDSKLGTKKDSLNLNIGGGPVGGGIQNQSPMNGNQLQFPGTFGSSVFEYKGTIVIPSLKHAQSNDVTPQQAYVAVSRSKQHSNSKPTVLRRIDDLMMAEDPTTGLQGIMQHRASHLKSPLEGEESKLQHNISNTLLNQSNNHLYHLTNFSNSGTQQQQQQQQPQNARFMNKRVQSNKQAQQLQAAEHHQQQLSGQQLSSTISHGTSGYHTQQQIQQNVQLQPNNASGKNPNVAPPGGKNVPLEVNDFSTNLNNNSRNFLARQQQQIQLQKQSRGMNPRQKSQPKSKNSQGGGSPQVQLQPQHQQQMIFVGSGVDSHGSLVHQYPNDRQSPFLPRNSSQTGINIENQNNQSVYHHPAQQMVPTYLVGSGSGSTRYDTVKPASQVLIQSNKQIIKKVLRTSKNSGQPQVKSNSQNRARESSPMDYQVPQMLGSTLQQQPTTTTTRYKKVIQPERRSLDKKPSQQQSPQIGLPSQMEVLNERTSSIGAGGNSGHNTSRSRGNSNNSRKIVIGKKGNIFGGVGVKATKSKIL